MCLHAAFDLLFVGLSTGVVASIDLLVSHAGMQAWARGCVGDRECWCVDGTYIFTRFRCDASLKFYTDVHVIATQASSKRASTFHDTKLLSQARRRPHSFWSAANRITTSDWLRFFGHAQKGSVSIGNLSDLSGVDSESAQNDRELRSFKFDMPEVVFLMLTKKMAASGDENGTDIQSINFNSSHNDISNQNMYRLFVGCQCIDGWFTT